jgi:DNA adenine methylase
VKLFYSPLRYPGGKGKLAEYIQLILAKNFLSDCEYVEPYAGGASVALSLLFNEYVQKIYINDIDKSIYAFWHSVLYNTEELCELIHNTPLNMKVWQTQHSIQKLKNNIPLLVLGFSTFYLNRCNRSGIIKGGVIGGKAQNGKWKIDARFNKKDLINRIIRIARYRDRIKLFNLDAIEFTLKIANEVSQRAFFYFDPPYFIKGKDLYVNFYIHKDHMNICDTIKNSQIKHWLVSYDNHAEIKDMYSQYRQLVYDLHYHASSPKVGKEVLIFSNNLDIPKVDNPIASMRVSA